MTFPHRAPPTGVRRLLWRQRVWFECTFGLAMLDTWEIMLVYSVLIILITLLTLSMYYYLPLHLLFLRSRAAYYITGQELIDPSLRGPDATAAAAAAASSAFASKAAELGNDAVVVLAGEGARVAGDLIGGIVKEEGIKMVGEL